MMSSSLLESDDLEGTVQVITVGRSDDADLGESWIQLERNTMEDTVRVVEALSATADQKSYLGVLEQELAKPGVMADLAQEKKTVDTLLKLVMIDDVSPTACKCLSALIRDKLRTIDLMNDVAAQLYDHFAVSSPERRRLAVGVLKSVLASPPFDAWHGNRRYEKIVHPFIVSLVPRIIGGLSSANISDSMELLFIILRRFGQILSGHKDFKQIQVLGDYLCTGLLLGKGSYANVYLGRHIRTAKTVAIKSMDWDYHTRGKPKQEQALTNEIEIMRTSEHPNIVRLYDTVTDGCYVHLMLEYCEAGTLEDYVKARGPLSEVEACKFLTQLALGLKDLNSRRIIHRDLKPENLLLAADETGKLTLKIADFTFARFIEPGDLATTLVGTPLYMAPEILLEHQYTEKADLWSVGGILYKMLTKEPPYPCTSYVELYNQIQSRSPRVPDHLSNDMKELLLSLLTRDPNLRISWAEFFLHPLLNLNALDQSVVGKQISASEQLMLRENELADALSQLEGFKANNKRLQHELGLLEQQLREKDQHGRNLADENEKLRAEITALKVTQPKDVPWAKLIAREQQISTELEADRDRWRNVADAKDAELEKLRAELATLSMRNEELARKDEEDTKNMCELSVEITKSRSFTEQLMARKDHYKAQVEQAINEKSQMLSELTVKDDEITTLKKKVQEMENELAAYQLHFRQLHGSTSH